MVDSILSMNSYSVQSKDEQVLNESTMSNIGGTADLYNLKEMDPPNTLMCVLHSYQIEAFYWMSKSEEGIDVKEATNTLHPCWEAYNLTDKKYCIHMMERKKSDPKLLRFFTGLQTWTVYTPRPVASKLAADTALLTGQRVLHALFPSILEVTCAIPGDFDCGKSIISQALSRYYNFNNVVYAGCGERGNEMAEVLMNFSQLTMTLPEGRK
ncbi:hypothetical protein GIB67_031175 [Kingdonia uniflora]|uniref:ATPase F1/V1/A1 complex alpha/beta subunit nucleotide-binding domain-containing protein n=1 Tax=Kingdonia uniflora TaxID=39325 RepID=A0A7J7NKW2_9MAGN|nr:hypothetical protein GIB67_031175 [Kingdonia uniflora]